MEFKHRFLPRRLSKSHSQALRGPINESRSDWEQEIQEIWCLNSSIKSNCPRLIYIVKEHLNLWANLVVTVRSAFNSRSTALAKRIRCDSLRLSRGHWIFHRLPRWCHIGCIIHNASSARLWILIEHFKCVSVNFNLRHYNSFDQRLRLNRFADKSDHATHLTP